MRKKWILGLLALTALLMGTQPNQETVPPQCTVAQLASGACAPAKLGTRVRVSNADVAIGDTNCASGTGANLILCEYNGTNWVASSASSVCNSSAGCLISDGTDWCVDSDLDGVACEALEPNFSMNAPTNSAGDETVQGNLTVVGAITETGVTQMHEALHGYIKTNTTVPTTGLCWELFNISSGPIACSNNSFHAPFKMRITRFCTGAEVSATLTNPCTIDLNNFTTTTVLASIRYADSGGDLTHAENQNFCATVNQDVAAFDELYIQANATTCNPAPTAWQRTFFQIYGYGID